MSEQRTTPEDVTDINPPSPLTDIPTPPAIDAIKKQIIKTRLASGGLVEPEENADSVPLSPDQKKQDSIIQAALINGRMLGSWLDTRGLREYSEGPYQLSKDLGSDMPGTLKKIQDSRYIDFKVTAANLTLRFVLFRNNELELDIDFPDLASAGTSSNSSGRKPIDKLTLQEAEVIAFYALDFLDTAGAVQKPAA